MPVGIADHARGLIMNQSALLIFAIIATGGLSLLLAFQFTKELGEGEWPAEAGRDEWLQLQPALLPLPDCVPAPMVHVRSPLAQAEVYWAYGRVVEAEAALAAGLRQGRVSPEEVARCRAANT
jgi:hypothetical protein